MRTTGRVRTTVELGFKGETKNLDVTFDVIDRASQVVDWASLPSAFALGQMPLIEAAKFVCFCLNEAGFDADVEDVYDELYDLDQGKSGLLLACELANAFSPKLKKKLSQSEDIAEAK